MTDWKNKWSISFDKSSAGERAIKPLGCTDSSAITTAGKAAASKEMEEEMRQKMAWRLVQQQAGGLPQQMFMMWMSGSQVHIFSIMMVVFSCRTPVMSFLNMSTNFARIEDKEMESQFVWQKVAYLGCNLAAACLSMYQLQRLGLLPTSDSDWLEFYEQSEPMEYSAGSLSL